VQNIIEAVNEIIGKERPEIGEESFGHNRLYRIAAGREASKSIPLVFGESKFWRLKHHGKNIRKKPPFKSIKLRLPADSIIFYRDDKEGIIAVSPEKNFVLKIFRDPPHILLLNREIETLKKIKGSDFEKFSTTYLNDGTTANGARWVMTDFRSNENSLKNYFNFEKNWLAISYTEIMPRMSAFYKINSPQFVKVSEWVENAQKRLESHPEAKKLAEGLKRISKDDLNIEILTSINHFDLHTGNVLRSREGEYSIIDWEGCYPAPVVIDAFDFLRRYLQKNRGEFKNFKVLSDDIFKKYQNWLREHFNQEVPFESKDLHFLIYAIERTLFFWEIAQINRLSDKRAVEKFILEA